MTCTVVQMKKCPKCGTEWPDDANFCPQDGTNMATLSRDDAAASDSTADYDDDGAGPDEDGVDEAFSDTQWFMAARDPEALKEEPTAEDLYDLQNQYERDETISEDDRSRFSLRKKKK